MNDGYCKPLHVEIALLLSPHVLNELVNERAKGRRMQCNPRNDRCFEPSPCGQGQATSFPG